MFTATSKHPCVGQYTTSSSSNIAYTDVTKMTEDEYGYVFVVLGDLTKLNCDYWLGPSGAGLDPKSQHDFPGDTARQYEVPCANGRSWSENGYMGALRTYHPWPAGLPKPFSIVLRVGRGRTESYIREIERFIRAAAADAVVRGCGHTNGPEKVRKHVCPLISIPLLGTGAGGNYKKTEDVFKVIQSCRRAFMLEHFEKRTNNNVSSNLQANSTRWNNVDGEPQVPSVSVSIGDNGTKDVTNDEDVMGMNMNYRLEATISGRRYLSAGLLEHVAHLSHQVSMGQLSLFVGAGASMGAGLPSWNDLIMGIAKEVGLSTELLEEFKYLDYYTKAAVLEKRISVINAEIDDENKQLDMQSESDRRGGVSVGSETYCKGCARASKSVQSVSSVVTVSETDATASRSSKEQRRKAKTLNMYISEMVTSSRYSLVHALLASLPVNEIITTNYDNLLEKALVLSGPFTTLPRTEDHGSCYSKEGYKKWLLKMHGCVTRPEEIVLTKQDYIRYTDRFAALSGIVQSLLLTKHLLFVGFSLDDDNFVRIFDSVKKAKGTKAAYGSGVSSNATKPSLEGSSFVDIEQRKIFGGLYREKNYVQKMMDKYKHLNGVNCFDDMEAEGSELAAIKGNYCGTALLLQHSIWKEALWGDEINMAFFSNNQVDHGVDASHSAPTSSSSGNTLPPPPPTPHVPIPSKSDDAQFAALARKQEIFLDLLSSQCIRTSTSGKFLMNDRYKEALTPGELEMKACLQRITLELVNLSDEAKKTGAFNNIRKSLKELGCSL